MNSKKPDLQDFGITPEEYAVYDKKVPDIPSRINLVLGFLYLGPVAVVFVSSLIADRDLEGALRWAFIAFLVFSIPLMIVAYLTQMAIVRTKRSRMLKGSFAAKIRLYQEAWTAYRNATEDSKRARREAERQKWEDDRARERAEWARQRAERERLRKLSEYWTSLSGVAFERELANLYRRLGYLVETTPGSGDQGIDLIVKKDDLTTIVQCKAHKSPVGPATARELYGSMVAYGADLATLASTGGFTKGVKDFVRGKPIALLSAYELAALGERGEGLPEQGSPPICPIQGCGKTMVIRTGRYGTFWGCPAFPKCKGTREYRGQ